MRQHLTTTNTEEKNKMKDSQQSLYFGCHAPHIRHLSCHKFPDYDGDIRRHLEARNNQSAMRNLPK